MQSKSRNSSGDRVFNIVNSFILILGGIIVLYPLYFIVIASFSNPDAVNGGQIRFLPVGFNLDGYKMVLNENRIWLGYRNSLFYMLSGTLLNVTLTVMAGYALSRKDLVGRSAIMKLLIFTMYFHGGLIPTFLLVKALGLYNNPLILIILGAVGVYNIIITRTFYQSNIPDELLEAAVIDGCGDGTFFIKIVLPLSKAITAVMVLFYAVGHWNQFFTALIYLKDQKLYPLQLFLREILIQNQMLSNSAMEDPEVMVQRAKIAEMLKYGVIIVSAFPVLMIYPFVQKHFVKGVMIGSVKG